VLGVNPDGTIAVQVSGGGAGYLCRLSDAGKLDTTYGVNGFLRLEAFGHLGGGPATSASSFLDSDGQVIVVVQGGSPLQIALRRVTARGQYDPTFGIGQPSVNPPPSNRAITLHSPPTESRSGPRYGSFASAGIAWLGRPRRHTLYLVGTATAGGELVSPAIGGLAVRRPAYPVLVVSAWTTQGERATSAIPGGAQEGGVLPFLYWYASGVLPESSTSLLVYGGGGTPREIQSQVGGGPVITETIAQRPGPALFRVTHPGGIDFGFGDHGAAVIQVPDFVPSVFAGGLSASGDRITLMHADLAEFQRNASYRNRFGGLARFI
jgi:hypothetical protein